MVHNNQNHWVYGLESLRLVLSKGSNRVGVSLPSPEDGFRNVAFSSYLELRAVNEVLEPRDSEFPHSFEMCFRN
jgi:hypothetical protein